MLCMCCIFFFKQKTAYEMRISDWSSDVCSSDLHPAREVAEALESEMEARAHRAGQPNLARPLGSHLPVSIRTLATSTTVMLGQRPEPPGRPLRHLPWTLGSVAAGDEGSNCPTLATFETFMHGQRPERPEQQ